MKTGWKDMYFAKQGVAAKKNRSAHSSSVSTKTHEKIRANANIGSDAEIAAYLARVPVAPRFETQEEPSDE